ncbi:MAG: hypothetical protein KDA69_06980 [Planctomycetaceae bacterium]|nr:hypothetical protein [Planctomycetaceae bacterium]MCA9044045.1 hypothetical protein [Planctomycetaceae bacterium]MCB9951123.1 hypothetical protein [Planctomycetaceae bacterium]
MASRRLQKRIEAEAAEKRGTTKKAKKATKKKSTTTRKRKTKAPERKRLLWGVFSGTLKEEGRYPYDQHDKAVERLEQLRAKSKKLYFIQPIKELLSAGDDAKTTGLLAEGGDDDDLDNDVKSKAASEEE